MGYSFYLIGKNKPILQDDFDVALKSMSEFNRSGLSGLQVCDTHYHLKHNYIRISGSFGLSGKYAEGFVLNMLICLQEMEYVIKVLSRDFEYGSKEDWENFNKM